MMTTPQGFTQIRKYSSDLFIQKLREDDSFTRTYRQGQKRSYTQVEKEKRLRFIEMVQQGGFTIKDAALHFSINYSTAKHIYKTYRQTGKYNLKIKLRRRSQNDTPLSKFAYQRHPKFIPEHSYFPQISTIQNNSGFFSSQRVLPQPKLSFPNSLSQDDKADLMNVIGFKGHSTSLTSYLNEDKSNIKADESSNNQISMIKPQNTDFKTWFVPANF